MALAASEDGWSFRSWQRGSSVLAKVPVLVVSGYPAATAFDARAILTKPVNPDTILDHVERLTG